MKLTDKSSVKGVIASMSLEDKLRAIQGGTMFKTTPIPEHGIPAVYMLDGGTGMNYGQAFMEALRAVQNEAKASGEDLGDLAEYITRIIKNIEILWNPKLLEDETEGMKRFMRKIKEKMKVLVPDNTFPGCFPPGTLLGSTWDGENIYQCGVALGKEAQFYGIDVLLGTPNVNIHRNPLNGRLFEGYSEDPCLTAKLAPELVKGVQSEGVIANVKHFAANNQETNRRGINEKIQERALREIYLPGFKACVDAGCKSVMSAYNSINGVPCAHNDWLLNKVLKEEWGFEGFVVSDWSAVYDQVDALNGGNDVEMPAGPGIDYLLKAVKEGRLKESTIDAALERFLNIIVDSISMKGRKYTYIDREFSRRAAYISAKEGIVLLKNEGVLPLSKDASVCFFGEKSKKFADSGKGSAEVITDQTSSMYEEIEKKLGAGKVTFEDITTDTDAVIITVYSMGGEGFDRQKMDLEPDDKAMLLDAISKAKAAGKKIVVVLNVCGPVDMREYIDDIDAVICVFYPGMEGGHVTAEILLGEVNPSGKLPLTFPKRYEDCPSGKYFPGRNMETWYGEGIFVGYRWYDYHEIEPLFPFGFGLSYTTFEITDAKLSENTFKYDEGVLGLTVKVKNTGNMAGKEVVQVYIGQENPTLIKPVKELKDFKKIELQPGEEKTLRFTITKEMLQSYDEEVGGWTVEPGKYRIYVGNSSKNIAHTLEFTAEGWNSFGFGENTPLDLIASNPEAFKLLESYCPDGTISIQYVRQTVLFSKAETLGEFWRNKVEPNLLDRDKDTLFAKLLVEINKFTAKAVHRY